MFSQINMKLAYINVKIENWSTKHVCHWLKQNNLSTLCEIFTIIKIDGRLLLELTEKDLKIDLGINCPKLRKQTLLRIQILKSQQQLSQMENIDFPPPPSSSSRSIMTTTIAPPLSLPPGIPQVLPETHHLIQCRKRQILKSQQQISQMENINFLPPPPPPSSSSRIITNTIAPPLSLIHTIPPVFPEIPNFIQCRKRKRREVIPFIIREDATVSINLLKMDSPPIGTDIVVVPSPIKVMQKDTTATDDIFHHSMIPPRPTKRMKEAQNLDPFVAKFENWSSLELDVLNKLFPTYGLMFDLYATHFIYKNIHQIEEHILSAMKFPPALQNQGPQWRQEFSSGGVWTTTDDWKLMILYKRHERKWVKYVPYFSGRTRNAIRQHVNLILMKRKKIDAGYSLVVELENEEQYFGTVEEMDKVKNIALVYFKALNHRRQSIDLNVINYQISQNTRKSPRWNHASTYRGVSWNKIKEKWRSMIRSGKKSILIGHYKNEMEAAQAYDIKAMALHGWKAVLNFPELVSADTKEQQNRRCLPPQNQHEHPFHGCTWDKYAQKWKAQFRQKHLGYFKDINEAAAVYDSEAKKQLGDNANLNFSHDSSKLYAELSGDDHQKMNTN